jgi:predicted ATPase
MTTGFSRLQVGYRRLRDLDFPMAPFNVLIGANGVGKTSVLEVMSVLAASAAGRLDETVRIGGGISSLMTVGRQEPLRIQLEMLDEQRAAIQYELHWRLRCLRCPECFGRRSAFAKYWQ